MSIIKKSYQLDQVIINEIRICVYGNEFSTWFFHAFLVKCGEIAQLRAGRRARRDDLFGEIIQEKIFWGGFTWQIVYFW